MRKSLLALSLLSVLSTPVLAAPPDDRQRIDALEAQVRALTTELQALKAQAATPVAVTPAVPPTQGIEAEVDALAAGSDDVAAGEQPVPASADASDATVAANGDGGSGSNPNAFNPAISIILNGSYAHHSLDPDRYSRVGFPLVGEGGPSPQGLSLGESELVLSSSIDDKFYGQLTLAIESEDGEDEVGVEEAYIDTTALPAGFSLRMGRFFSNIGYLNNHHAHTDNFTDRPLGYQAFLGNQYGDDGVQLRWVAPTDLFVELGGEVLRGQNYPSGGAKRSGVGTQTLFAHFGGDVGTESSWLAGVSMLKTRTEAGEDGFSGDARLYVADATWKWAPQGNTKDGGITLRGEYFLDDRDGVFADPEDPALVSLWNGQRSGAYVEAIWRLNRLWDVGYRYDKLWADSDGPYASAFDPDRHTAELTWRNSEFGLVRLQFSHDKPNPSDTDNGITLQYQTALGAHGAHKY